MTKLSESTIPALLALADTVEERIKECEYLEEAAQTFTDIVYEEFKDSIVLARLFATVPFGELPEPNQRHVNDLAATAGITPLINDQTLVLSLLGTRGQEPAWDDRHNSRGHVGIPLASGDFIDAIPMMSRLLKELELGLDWIDSQDTAVVAKTMGRLAGVFYVSDAKTAVDNQGRKIIAAQDFVSAYGVKSVFGMGGGYLTSNGFITIIVFLREEIEKRRAEHFMPLISAFKNSTMNLAADKSVFAPSAVY